MENYKRSQKYEVIFPINVTSSYEDEKQQFSTVDYRRTQNSGGMPNDIYLAP
jgi:hypothetical protein